MSYTPITDIHGTFIHNDFVAARSNYRHALWLVKDARERGDEDALTAAQAAYSRTRAHLTEVQKHVQVAGGHPHLPESV